MYKLLTVLNSVIILGYIIVIVVDSYRLHTRAKRQKGMAFKLRLEDSKGRIGTRKKR